MIAWLAIMDSTLPAKVCQTDVRSIELPSDLQRVFILPWYCAKVRMTQPNAKTAASSLERWEVARSQGGTRGSKEVNQLLLYFPHHNNSGKAFGERGRKEAAGHARHDCLGNVALATAIAAPADLERDVKEDCTHFVAIACGEAEIRAALLGSEIRGVHVIAREAKTQPHFEQIAQCTEYAALEALIGLIVKKPQPQTVTGKRLYAPSCKIGGLARPGQAYGENDLASRFR